MGRAKPNTASRLGGAGWAYSATPPSLSPIDLNASSASDEKTQQANDHMRQKRLNDNPHDDQTDGDPTASVPPSLGAKTQQSAYGASNHQHTIGHCTVIVEQHSIPINTWKTTTNTERKRNGQSTPEPR